MNKIKLQLIVISILLIFTGCEKNDVKPLDYYYCQFHFNDSSEVHPKANLYQGILDANRKQGLVGAVLLVKDKDGLWIGASGKSDIASNTDMKSCNSFLIASISKVFTATALYRYVDKGMLSLEDPVNRWIDQSITDRIANANEAKIKHLLSHTAGIADFYSIQFDLDRLNRTKNGWHARDVIKMAYGKKANHPVGEGYWYSNSHYVLLSIILENVSAKPFGQIYQEEIFEPLQLHSAYYNEENPIPENCVKGYADLYNNGQFGESRFFYEDELGIGGDGGIAINAYDLSIFLEKLAKGKVISENSFTDMTHWFDLPKEWHSPVYKHTENGYGIQKLNTDYGYAIGHTGAIPGFHSYGFYFPEEEMTYILLVNSVDGSEAEKNIFQEVLAEMFE